MHRRTLIIVAAIAAAVLAIGGGAYWLSRPSYDDIANNCISALKERPKSDKVKPGACDGLTEDDYQTILMSNVIDDLGWTDDEGNFDEGEMLDGVIEP